MTGIGTEDQPLRVAIVGSGPTGFYVAAPLLKDKELSVSIDMLDRLPTPFGLVRGGVAPDHQKTKSVIKAYDRTAQDPRFRFFGNVELGRDVSLEDLQTPGMVVQIGQPPKRIDLLTDVSGLDFEEAWSNRTTHSIGPRAVPFLSREDLIRNKRASGRPKDFADLDVLEDE